MTQLAGAGSNRKYFRFTAEDGSTMIGVKGTSIEENTAFIEIAKHFKSQGINVPEVYAYSKDKKYYLQQDLGNKSLFDAIARGRNANGSYDTHEYELLKRTIRQLPVLQVKGGQGLDYKVCYPQPAFDCENIFFDLNYFKYCYLKITGIDFHELKLENDFHLFAEDLLRLGDAETFMYRDFQARNIMLDADGNPWFIDFQGGRKGPVYYDVASFLWQASAKYSDELRDKLISEYYDALSSLIPTPPINVFRKNLTLFVLFRTIQVLGAYGFRGYFERKKHFIDSIPHAINNLRNLLENNVFHYPYLVSVLQKLVELSDFSKPDDSKPCEGNVKVCSNTTTVSSQSPSKSSYDNQGELVVRVMSFSYKKGIPEDPSGNGGGYVFDCRSTHNPGRYEPYKKLTGLDAPVKKFLEDDGEIMTFLESVYALADKHVERYIQRGFTSLMFCFGCTGGQHRSVYSAQHLAEHLHHRFGIKVLLTHREQNIQQTFSINQE